MRRLMAVAVLVLGMAAGRAVAGETYIYTGALGSVGHDNGPMGFGQWLVYGAANLGDNDDSTGVWFPPLANWYGNPVAGAFGVMPFDDGRIPYDAEILAVTATFRIRCATATGNRMQMFVHRHNDPTFVEPYQWGELTWQSQPWNQTPIGPPLLEDWTPTLWTDVHVHYTVGANAQPWTRTDVFKACYGLWAMVPQGGGIYLSEWSLSIDTR